MSTLCFITSLHCFDLYHKKKTQVVLHQVMMTRE